MSIFLSPFHILCSFVTKVEVVHNIIPTKDNNLISKKQGQIYEHSYNNKHFQTFVEKHLTKSRGRELWLIRRRLLFFVIFMIMRQ